MVYNHTAEAITLGRRCPFGIDNAAYYRLMADDPAIAWTTLVWNSLNVRHPRTLQLIMDGLRYCALICTWMGFDSTSPPHWPGELHEVDRHQARFRHHSPDPISLR